MEDMVGTWKLESRENNFDDFMKCREASWFLRTIIGKFSADVEYSLSEDRSVFTKKTISSYHSNTYPIPTTGEFTPEKTLSGKPEIGCLMETSGRKVIQEMRFKETDEVAALIEHQVIDSKLHVWLKCKDIVCEEVYVKK